MKPYASPAHAAPFAAAACCCLALILGSVFSSPIFAQGDKKPAAKASGPSPVDSLVRVNATLQSYNFIRPWEKGAPTPRRGLGAVIPGNRVLVTAELVVNSTYIELEKAATGEKAPARIVGLDYEANLALLEPQKSDAGFLEDLKPLKLDDSVLPGDEVEVWQIEDNGDGVRTSADVLRVAVGNYFISGSVFLVYQIKGSLQYKANSFTIPIVKDDKLVGLLITYNSKEQTSQILPAPIIEHFLADVDDGDYQGFPNLGLSFDQTLDEALRRFTGIENEDGGVYVREVVEDSSAGRGGLKVGDVILRINGRPIDSRGNYEDEKYGKLNFSHLVRGNAQVGDVVKMDIVRDGKPKTLEIKLDRREPQDYLIDPYMFDRGPRYLLSGGLLFQELTRPYLESWGDQWRNRAPFKLVHALGSPERFEEEGREKLVFLSQVLRTPNTLGYEQLGGQLVTKANGKPINKLSDLAEALKTPWKDGIHKIEFDDFPKVIYVDDRLSKMVDQELMRYGIVQLSRLN